MGAGNGDWFSVIDRDVLNKLEPRKEDKVANSKKREGTGNQGLVG